MKQVLLLTFAVPVMAVASGICPPTDIPDNQSVNQGCYGLGLEPYAIPGVSYEIMFEDLLGGGTTPDYNDAKEIGRASCRERV